MDRNKTFNCRGNNKADLILFMLESNSVLSNTFTYKIQSIVLVILTNLDTNKEWVRTEIDKLRSEMNWMLIFSTEFTEGLYDMLTLAMEKQIELNSKESIGEQ